LEENKDIVFLSSEDVYTKDGFFDPDRMIELLIYETEKAVSEGYPSILITAEMTWALKGVPGSDRLIEYEGKVNEKIFKKYPCTAICQYNFQKFSSGQIEELLRIQPLILWEDELIKNIFFMDRQNYSPEEFKKKCIEKYLYLLSVEKALEKRIRDLEVILNAHPFIGIAIAIDEPPKFIFVNNRFADIFGLDKGEFFRMNPEKLRDIIHPDDFDLFINGYKSVLNGELKFFNQRIRGINRNKDLIWLMLLMNTIDYMDTECVEIVISDITETVLKEEEFKKLREQFFLAQKMEAIGKLTAGVAHDFNNILTAIKGFTQLSISKLSENDPVRKYLENVQAVANKAENLIKQLLAFSRKQILEPKVININDLIKSMEDMLKRLLGEDILLFLRLSTDLGNVNVDPVQIEQAIVNIVVNAKDAMPTGGSLTIETANVELDENYVKKHHAVKAGSYVMIAITDTGVGIPPEIRDRIFEPFFTTKEGGSGLGLSTVYGIVKHHGGNIWVYSEVGKVTTFKIYLPMVDKEVEQDVFEKQIDKIIRGNETILVIDDDENTRAVILEMLRNMGYKTLEAKDADMAVFLAQFYDKPIHLVISDVVMPGMSGPRLIRRMNAYRPNLKVLYMSGYTDNVIAQHGILKKGVNFIQKPFSMEALSRKIREVLDKA
jgi:PAS domain S-box-containing protein